MIGEVDYDMVVFCWDEEQVEAIGEYIEQAYMQKYMLSMLGAFEQEE
jgi:hypothetical protein